jgi:hypothetical protein
VGPQLGQQREDLLGRLGFAENYFRDTGPPPTIYVQHGELAQRDARLRRARTLSRHG